MVEAFPGQCARVQQVLHEHAGLHYLILRDIQRVKLPPPYRGVAAFSPFAKEVADRLKAAGENPYQAAKKKIVIVAMELAKITPRKAPLRVIKLSHRDGKKRYIEHLKRRIDAENAIILRAADRIDKLRKKIKDIQELRS
jgi:hypothetical protein